MYDYEWFPQVQDPNWNLARLRMSVWEFFNKVDGFLSSTTSVLEEGLTIATKEYMNGLGKPFFSVGFPATATQSSDHPRNEVESQVSTFLAKMEEKFGASSVVYVCGFHSQ